MSSEETELTFVRCPSCRSLVPAVATRCRMCGFQFEGSGENTASKPEPKEQNRVRQNTVTLDDHEGSSDDSGESFEDTAAKAPRREPTPKNSSLMSEASEHSASAVSSEDNTQADDSKPDNARRKRRRKRKKKPAESNDLNVRSEQGSQEPSRVQDEKPRDVSARDVKVSDDSHRNVKKENKVIKEESLVDNQISSDESVSEGVLVGWLVNYEQDSNGASIEIRAGKYFVARQRLRDGDLVIPDSAISTPHCLVKASRGVMHIQDLMSEQGTFIKKKGSNSFVPVKDMVSAEHGDSLKLGASYEVVVCLVP